jgi:hypothetical protein
MHTLSVINYSSDWLEPVMTIHKNFFPPLLLQFLICLLQLTSPKNFLNGENNVETFPPSCHSVQVKSMTVRLCRKIRPFQQVLLLGGYEGLQTVLMASSFGRKPT